MVIGALLVAVAAGIGVHYARKNKPLAVILAVVAAVALLIGAPAMLSWGGPQSASILIIIGLVGLVVTLWGLMSSKSPTAPLLVLGALLIAWAAFRYLPNGPIAFQHLAVHLNKAGSELWTGIKDFPRDLFGRTAKLPAK